jgi:hypothetical protein
MTERLDLFTVIHKGLRWWIGDLGARLGATDFTNAAEAILALKEVVECLETLDAHSLHEDSFIAPVLDARAASRGLPWHDEHEALQAATTALRRQVQELVNLGPTHAHATGLGLELYRAFSRFASDVYLHLDEEETRLMPLLWSVCTDEELLAIMTAFRSRHAAESAVLYARVAAAFTPSERALLGV